MARNRLARKIRDIKASSPVRLIGNGKYRIEGEDKVYDILTYNQGKKVKFVGKHKDDLEKAVISEFVLNGKTQLDAFQSIRGNDLPQQYLGPASRSFYLPKSVADLIKDIETPLYNSQSAAVNRMMKGYDAIIAAWKIPLLAPWGSTWMRNGIGNVTQGMIRAGLGLFDPLVSKDFYKVYFYALAEASPSLRKLRGWTDKKWGDLGDQPVSALGDSYRGKPMTVRELHEEMGQRGVLSGMWYAEIDEGFQGGQRVAGAAMVGSIGLATGGPVGGMAGAVVGGLLGRRAANMKGLFKAGELASELPTRLMLGMNTYKKTGSLLEMGDDVRHYMHDYSDLSQFERRYMRRAIPFYNFVKMAGRVMGNGVFDSPGMVMLPHKLFNNDNMKKYDLDGDGVFDPGVDDPVMPEDYPDFWHGHLKLVGKELDDEGNVRTWIKAGFNPPMQEMGHLIDAFMPGGKDITALGSRGAFFPVSIIESLTNYDTFRLSKIEPTEPGEKTSFSAGRPYRNSPDWMRNFVGYERHPDGSETANPRFAWLLGEMPTSRFTNVAKQIYDSDTPGDLNYNALSKVVLAWSTYRYDEETQQYFQNNAKIEAMEAVLMNIGALKKYHNNVYIDPQTGDTVRTTKTKTKQTGRRSNVPTIREQRNEIYQRIGVGEGE